MQHATNKDKAIVVVVMVVVGVTAFHLISDKSETISKPAVKMQ